MVDIIKRIRDKKHIYKPQQHISYDQWQQILDRASQAAGFMQEKNLVYTMLLEGLQSAEEIVLQNRVREVREEVTVSEQLKKVFITPKKVQDDELVGQIKLIRETFKELQGWIDFKTTMVKKEADGDITIERELHAES